MSPDQKTPFFKKTEFKPQALYDEYLDNGELIDEKNTFSEQKRSRLV
jgi:hypothetical protein